MHAVCKRYAWLPIEMRRTALLAAPVVAGQFSAMGMNVVDTVLAGRHGALTLAAVAVGSAVWSLVLLVVLGVLMAVPPSVSQLDGAGRRDEIGALFRQACWLALALGLALFAFVRASSWLLAAVGIAPEVQPRAIEFLHALSWGAPALAGLFVCRNLSEGLHWTLPTMVSGVAGLLALIPLGYALMFGTLGLPELGAAGLGYATALVTWLQLLGMVVYLSRSSRFTELAPFGRFEPPRRAPIAELLRVGMPMGASVFMEGSLFVATALAIGTIGAVQVAAHQIAISLASLAFMVPLGVAMATTVRVGSAVGRDDRSGVRRAGAAGYGIVLLTQTVSALALLLGAESIAALYTRDAAVAALAAVLMVYAAAFQFSDGIQAASAGALRGLKDTRVPMWITMASYWGLGMSLGLALGLGLELGAAGMWWGLIVGLSAAAFGLTRRFVRMSAARP
ncbi:MAG TPA: MATE family efflux transporter [Xanthomonadaceae bacterium]|nr:MATE family efflux transporter [Xanthomonadaceae bacterium]